MKIASKIDNLKLEWDKINTSNFLRISFIEIFYINHKKIKHLFILDKDIRLYAHIFSFRFNKTTSYLKNRVLAFLIGYLNFNVLYLTNTFITNIPAFISKKKINLDKILTAIKYSYNLLVIPDFVYNNIENNDYKFHKIEVEEDMVLEIRKEWKNINDYTLDFKKKYKNKIKQVLKSSNEIKIKQLNHNDIINYSNEIKNLFYQVINESKFNGPLFNTNAFKSLIKQDIFKIYGYFINKDLIAFSSELREENILYSYYVGFNKSLNKKKSIYSRILIETINNAIMLKMNKVVFGRTANEFKSNFGAKPIKSYVYINIKNKYLKLFLLPIIKRLAIKNWKQRNPFKNNRII